VTGISNVIDVTSDVGVAAAGYDGDGLIVATTNVEAPRLIGEQLPSSVVVKAIPWHEGWIKTAVAKFSPRPAAVDVDVLGFGMVDAAPLRRPLSDAEAERYRTLGAATTTAVETVCRDCKSSDSERDVAAAVYRRLVARGIQPTVLLVGGCERAAKYRHPTPTTETLGDYAVVSITATRAGLHASCTRTVAFDLPEWLLERHEAASRVEATALAATTHYGRHGGTASDVFRAIQDAYAAVGWRDEWRRHHQGGMTGYAGREWIGTPTANSEVVVPHAYAWNPTVEGAKSEDTALVTADGHELLTESNDWPSRSVAAVGFNEVVTRPAVLHK
jgi:hypothetical protein